jgi:hypothetical protein
MRTVISTVVVVVASALAGCANFQTAVHFTPSKLSGIEESKTALLLLRDSANGIEGSPELTRAIDENAEIREVLVKQCGYGAKPSGPGPAIAPALVPILASLAEVGFNLWADQQQRKIDEIVSAAQAEYAASLALSASDLDAIRCAAFVRYTQQPEKSVQLGMFSALTIRRESVPAAASFKMFSVEPVYVRMFNAVAITKDSNEPKASLSIALSIKAVGLPEGGVERLLPSGEGVVSIPQVRLGSAGTAKCAMGGCKRSDLIPYPTGRGTLSFTVAVVERGVTGFDDKAASAELSAVKAALGPAFGEAVKKKFGE